MLLLDAIAAIVIMNNVANIVGSITNVNSPAYAVWAPPCIDRNTNVVTNSMNARVVTTAPVAWSERLTWKPQRVN